MREIKFRAWDKKNKKMIYILGIMYMTTGVFLLCLFPFVYFDVLVWWILVVAGLDWKFILVLIPVFVLFGTIFHSWITGKGLWN